MSKLCIFIIGGSSCGKTTLSRNLHNWFSNLAGDREEPELMGWGNRNREYMFTKFSRFSANLGDLSGGACSGTDTLATKERIFKSYDLAIEESPVVIVEGLMATATWIDHFQRKNIKVFLIHLDISDEENFKRLRIRRAKKQGIKAGEVILSTKTKDNLSSKLRNFRNLYAKLSPRADFHAQIQAEAFTPQETADIIIRFMEGEIFC